MLTDAKVAAIKPPESGQDEYPDHMVTGLRLRVGAGGKKTWTLRRRVGSMVVNRKIGTYPATSLAAARKAAGAMIAELRGEGSSLADESMIVIVRMQSGQLAAVDAWADDQQDKPSRPEAVRRLVNKGLEVR